ncbi:hypothetical protein PF011_g29730 [Phytophthora fragariae]|uniref:Secreted protein n=1 Tax=Phytophthora fragariae TaxID=53985 RepID=A0A6A3GX54_9STRA|nr:hypothetical protein PF011_g29730 [Phytophthora fragariae]
MCGARGVYPLLLAMLIAALLSMKMSVAHPIPIAISLSSCRTQNTSCTVTARAMYSASADDSATVACFFALNTIGPPHSCRSTPDVDRKVDKSLPQFASLNASRRN